MFPAVAAPQPLPAVSVPPFGPLRRPAADPPSASWTSPGRRTSSSPTRRASTPRRPSPLTSPSRYSPTALACAPPTPRSSRRTTAAPWPGALPDGFGWSGLPSLQGFPNFHEVWRQCGLIFSSTGILCTIAILSFVLCTSPLYYLCTSKGPQGIKSKF